VSCACVSGKEERQTGRETKSEISFLRRKIETERQRERDPIMCRTHVKEGERERECVRARQRQRDRARARARHVFSDLIDVAFVIS